MVQVIVHLEPSQEPGGVVWWAESDDVPGFAAAADSLAELRIRVMDALRDIEQEEGRDLDRLAIDFHLAAAPASTEAEGLDVRVDGVSQERGRDDRSAGPVTSTVPQPVLA